MMFYRSKGCNFIKLDDKTEYWLNLRRESFTEDDHRVGQMQEWLNNNTDGVDRICVKQVKTECFNSPDYSMRAGREITEILLRDISGWHQYKGSSGSNKARCGDYGLQVCFERDYHNCCSNKIFEISCGDFYDKE